MKLLIDTCNVLHRTGILPPELAGIDEEGLARLVQESRYRNLKVDFMCDGPQVAEDGRLRSAPWPGCRFTFAGRAGSADQLIISAVQASSSPRKLLMVSSDRAIQIAAKKRRCRVLSSDDFLRQLAWDANTSDRRRRSGSGSLQDVPRSAAFWMKEFGLEIETEPGSSPRMEPVRRPSSPSEAPSSDPVPPPKNRAKSDEASPEADPGAGTPEELRWRALMEEADRLWTLHQESNDQNA